MTELRNIFKTPLVERCVSVSPGFANLQVVDRFKDGASYVRNVARNGDVMIAQRAADGEKLSTVHIDAGTPVALSIIQGVDKDLAAMGKDTQGKRLLFTIRPQMQPMPSGAA